MREAYYEAFHAVGLSDPNPAVGALVVSSSNEILGRGFSQESGSHHAEVMAIENAQKNSGKPSLVGSALYVTLEPCCHHGRTPPCVDKIVKSKIAAVVIDQKDPSEKVNGRGIKALKENGIHVSLLRHPELELEKLFTLRPFLKVQKRGLTSLHTQMGANKRRLACSSERAFRKNQSEEGRGSHP